MSTFTEKQKIVSTPLDGPSDLKPKVKTTIVIQQEAEPDKKAKKKSAKSSK
tara:strand:+ start:267 stop:419 length:153 start_codon:yes stop_codon:yes gene_type:complete